MINGLCKVLTVGVVVYCATDGLKNVDRQIDQFAAIPKRVMTVYELKQIHRLIQYELVGASSAIIRMSDFCAKNLQASGRDPGTDYWKTPYRLFFEGTMYGEHSSVSMAYEDSDKYLAVSAGQDKSFYTADDLTSRSSTDEQVKRLQEQIEAEIKKQKDLEKSKGSPGEGKS